MNLEPCREELTPDERKELAAVLHSTVFRKAAGKVLALKEDMDRLSVLHLNMQEGLVQAVRRQGEVRGIALALSFIHELTEEDDHAAES